MQIITFRKISLLIFVVLLMACGSTNKAIKINQDEELIQFASLLQGNFSSKKQSETDSAYFNISLSMTRIWEDRNDAIWLYVEQALASSIEKPYRQRVYKLNHHAKDKFTSDVFTIKDQERFIGLQFDAGKKKLLNDDMIEFKEGCTVTLIKQKDSYLGGTDGERCRSDLRGAKYATTKIVLKKGFLESWDQGFDSTGKQVWGATKGGYQFLLE